MVWALIIKQQTNKTMKNNNETSILEDLNISELISIEGGAPSADTGFFYDAAYYTVIGAKLYLYAKWHININ